MRKFLLGLAAVAVLVPSVALRANAANQTAVFQYSATGSPPLAAGASGANGTAGFGVQGFYAELGKVAGSCDLSSAGAVLKADASIIKKITTQAGDTTYAIGTITVPAGNATGAESGEAWFAGWSASAGLTNGQILNTTNLPTAAILCGGAQGCPGNPANAPNTHQVLCTNSDLQTKSTLDPNNLTNCATSGGQVNETGAYAGTESITSFVYPLAGNLCKGEVTLAECCNDAKLVIISNTLQIQNHHGTVTGAPDYLSIPTSQGDGGAVQAWIQE